MVVIFEVSLLFNIFFGIFLRAAFILGGRRDGRFPADIQHLSLAFSWISLTWDVGEHIFVLKNND